MSKEGMDIQILKEFERNKSDKIAAQQETDLAKKNTINLIEGVWGKEIESGVYNKPIPIKVSKSNRFKMFFYKLKNILGF